MGSFPSRWVDFIKDKVRRGEMRPATPDELKDRDCSHDWHFLPLDIRAGQCPVCGQRLSGWLYEVAELEM